MVTRQGWVHFAEGSGSSSASVFHTQARHSSNRNPFFLTTFGTCCGTAEPFRFDSLILNSRWDLSVLKYFKNQPVISIVTATYNKLDLTQSFWASLLSHPPGEPWEIIWIDDGSTDGTREWLDQLGTLSIELLAKSSEPRASTDSPAIIQPCSNPPLNIRVILNNKNLGYAANNNLGAHSAHGDILVFLNNDLVLTPGWIEPLLEVLNVTPPPSNFKTQPQRTGLNQRMGIIGNVQLQVATGLIDHAGIYFDLVGMPVHQFKNRPKSVLSKEGIHCRAVTAACWCVRREVFLEAGGFDPGYRNGLEDIDLCLRLGKLGYSHWVEYRSVIWHHVSSSPGRTKFNDANRALFLKEWAGVSAKYGQEEWPREYLKRVLRNPRKINFYKTFDALLRIVGLRKGDSSWAARQRMEFLAKS